MHEARRLRRGLPVLRRLLQPGLQQAEISPPEAVFSRPGPEILLGPGPVPEFQILNVRKGLSDGLPVRSPSARQGHPVKVLGLGGREHRLQGFFPAPGDIHSLCEKPGQSQLDRRQPDLFSQLNLQDPFGAGLVPAPAHGAAGPGAKGLPGLEAASLVHVAQSQIL